MRILGLVSFKKNQKRVVNNSEDLIFENGFIQIINKSFSNISQYLIQINQRDSLATYSNLFFSTNVEKKRFFFINPDDIDSELPNLDIGIWINVEDNTIRLLRNNFGTVPLYYINIPQEFFAFSTDLPSLLKLEEVKPFLQININRLVRYCTFKGDSITDYNEETFYKNVKTVLPGHILESSPVAHCSIRYLKFDPLQWSHLESSKDFANIFLDRLKKSVERSIEKGLIGAHLSGGLDSSSLSSLTKYLYPDRELLTLYASTKTKLTNENHHAFNVAEQIGSKHFEVTPQENDFELLTLYTSIYGHPECMLASPSLQGTLISFAKDHHCEQLLIGHDGDSIAGTGLNRIIELFYKKNWKDLLPLLNLRLTDPSYSITSKNWINLSDKKKLRIIYNNFFSFRFAEISKRHSISYSLKLFFDIRAHFDISILYFIKRAVRSIFNKILDKNPKKTILRDTVISKGMGTLDSNALSNSLGENVPTKFQDAIKSVFNAQPLLFCEELYALGNYYEIRNCLPFYDKELFEISMATPVEFKLGSGLGRQHFRDAMQGILLESVRSRSDKAVFGLYGRESAIRMHDQAQAILKKSSEVWHYIDKEKFSAEVKILMTENLSTHVYSRSQFHVVRTISLAVWLDWYKNNITGS